MIAEFLSTMLLQKKYIYKFYQVYIYDSVTILIN